MKLESVRTYKKDDEKQLSKSNCNQKNNNFTKS